MNWKPLVNFGNFSFSFYMIHTLSITVFLKLIKISTIDLHPLLKMAIILLTTIALSWCIYNYFEKPVSKYLLKKYQLVK